MSWSLEKDAEGLEKFHLSSTCEKSYCRDSLLFKPKTMSVEQINLGYEHNDAFLWLRERGSIDGQYEAQTVLMVQDEKVRAGQDEAMEVPNETQIQNECYLCNMWLNGLAFLR